MTKIFERFVPLLVAVGWCAFSRFFNDILVVNSESLLDIGPAPFWYRLLCVILNTRIAVIRQGWAVDFYHICAAANVIQQVPVRALDDCITLGWSLISGNDRTLGHYCLRC